METNRRLIFLALIITSLAGCAEQDKDVAILARERDSYAGQLAVAKENIKQQMGAEQARIEYFERQASIARGCDLIIPVCPPSLTEPGHRAITNGFAGTSWWVWLIFAVKLVVLCTASGFAVAAFLAAKIRLANPAKIELENAINLIETSKAKAEQTNCEISELETRSNELKCEIYDLNKKIDSASQELEWLENSITKASIELDTIKAAQRALGSF